MTTLSQEAGTPDGVHTDASFQFPVFVEVLRRHGLLPLVAVSTPVRGASKKVLFFVVAEEAVLP
jgi:hypothetical protein